MMIENNSERTKSTWLILGILMVSVLLPLPAKCENESNVQAKSSDHRAPDFAQNWNSPCGKEFTANIDTVTRIEFSASPEWFATDSLHYFIASIDPEPTGQFYLTQPTNDYGRAALCVKPDSLDAIKQFEVKIGATNQSDTALCQFTVNVPQYIPMRVSIGVVKGTGGRKVSLNVSLDKTDIALSGFSFLFAYDGSAMSFMGAEKGSDFYGHCRWEYFTFLHGDDLEREEKYPSGLIKVVGIADSENGNIHPDCYQPPLLPAKLFDLNFILSNDRTLECQLAPVRFYWASCEDNVLTANDGDKIYIANGIYNASAPELDISTPDHPGGYPTYLGPQNIDCFQGSDQLVRRVGFNNGGVHFDYNHCWQPDIYGDITLNEINYEITDYLLFAKYFVYGASVFTVNPDTQIAATDINRDGIVLSLDNLVMLGLIIEGYFTPFTLRYRSSPDSADFFIDKYGTLSVISDLRKPIRAVQIILEGETRPLLLAEQMEMQYNFDSWNNITRVLIHSLDIGDNIDSGQIVEIPGKNKILKIEAATLDARNVIVDLKPTGDFSTIRIGHKRQVWQGYVDSIAITMDNGPLEVGGFDFLIQYHPDALRFLEVTPGQFIKECDWEFFSYQVADSSICGNAVCPLGIVRIRALADLSNGTKYPSCYNVERENSNELAVLHFSVSNDRTLECYHLPIRFIWYDDNDNILLSRVGGLEYVSNSVSEYESAVRPSRHPTEITNLSDSAGYPTIHGHQSTDYGNQNQAAVIDFYNGYVGIACMDVLDCMMGDINLNEIMYEYADYQLFTDYFLYGLSVFTTNFPGQVASTDVNRDGIALSLEDLVYMGLVIAGAADSCEGSTDFALPDTAEFTYYRTGKLVIAWQSHLRVPIQAVHIELEGRAHPNLLAEQMEAMYHYDDSTNSTKVLIHSLDLDANIGREKILFIPGKNKILKIEAASLDARKVIVVIK